ncbi:MAG: hypothetical protein WDM71_00835 [Ferruginibacter sp.]
MVIEAHADEISWFINYISSDGLIYLKRNGGVDHQIAPAKRVLIHGKKGPVKAVFGWPAIHTRMANTDSKKHNQKLIIFFWIVVQELKKKWRHWAFILVLLQRMKKVTKSLLMII